MEINKSSWHYKWLEFWYSAKISWLDIDHVSVRERLNKNKTKCQYYRSVFLWPFINFVTAGLTWGAVINLVASHGTISGVSNIVLAIIIFLGIILIFAFVIYLIIETIEITDEKISSLKESKGIIGDAYHTYKSNYCPLIYFKGDDDV